MQIMQDLFANEYDPDENQLPYDGTVRYWGAIFDVQQSDNYFHQLMKNIAWQNDEVIIYGKHIVTQRKIAWYADRPHTYTYSNISRQAHLWNELLLELKRAVEEKTKQQYNSCLLNLYHNGAEGLGWHSDGEEEMKHRGSIASLSFGATRKFAFKHIRTKERLVFELHNGDLLEMKNETQQHWIHNVPTTKKIHTPRISLTFRQTVGG